MIPKYAKKIPLKPLAYGESTGHIHAVAAQDEGKAEMYDMGDGLALRVVDGKVRIVHGKDPSNLAPVEPGEDRHGIVVLDPQCPEQVRQGDVLLTPMEGFPSFWEVSIQAEEGPDEILRQVAD